MLKLLSFLVSGCWHEWQFLKYINYYGDGFGNMTKYPSAVKAEYECRKCGIRKKGRI